MKIATFNINNVNRRLPNLLAWLKATKPAIVCLQELKAAQDAFPHREFRDAGYQSVWKGQQTWNGVAILSRIGAPVLIRDHLPGDKSDTQARYIEAAIKGIVVGCLYAPNGNPQPGPKFDYKLRWLQRLRRHGNSLLAYDAPIVLAGDYNVAPTDLDIYPTTSWNNDALIHPKSRRSFASLTTQGWTDALRTLHPDERVYTFWHYMRRRWENDHGLRLDHLLLNDTAAKRLRKAGVDKTVRGEAGASDHAPAWIILRD